jgi:carboxyl-terminal processing protease
MRRYHFILPLIIITVSAFVGGLAGGYLRPEKEPPLILSQLAEAMKVIEENYMEKVSEESILKSAISGMLSELDPHSSYITAEEYKNLEERYRGDYEGIGITFDIIDGVLIVISTIEGGPSAKLGIRAGDNIIAVDGKSIVPTTTEEVFRLLRGPRGTEVTVTVRRPGLDKLLNFTIIRDRIPIYSVSYKFILDSETGYIRLNRFSQTTHTELEEALTMLEKQGMKRLLLDLRGNIGGYLIEAVQVADKFLPRGRKIVFTMGRTPDSNEEFYSTGRDTHPMYPIIVLINHGSASASEIVAGALQDWDRGVVIGERSFGKGLVQTQFRLPNGGALFLTTAKYYTPSGRLIQRNYKGNENYFLEGYGEITIHPDEEREKEREFYLTAGGRKVYGGGGITPDIVLKSEYFSNTVAKLRERNLFFAYGSLYASHHKELAGDLEGFLTDFKISDETIADFRRFLKREKLKVNQQEFEKDIKFVKLFLKSEIAANLFNEVASYRVLITADTQLNESLKHFPEAESLLSLKKGEPKPYRLSPESTN